MTDISNRTLAILVLLAITVSLIGIFNMPEYGVVILGAATNTTSGTANVTIESITQISLQNNTVDFGTGFVNSTDNFCILESNNTFKTAACQGFNAPAKSAHFVIENTGNVNVTLDVNGTFLTARAFLCEGTNAQRNCTLANPEYNWSADNLLPAPNSVACLTADQTKSFARNLNTTAQRVCTNFLSDPTNSKNKMKVSIRLMIPRDSRLGTLNDSVLFTATSG